jgi:hypothetical protein
MKRMLALVMAVAAVGVLATAGSAKPTKRSGPLHVTKNCSEYTFALGGFCTITSSNIPAIKPGMKVVYLAAPVPGLLDADIALGSGSGTALGDVVLNTNTFQGRVAFSVGTGMFRGFTARAAVSLDPATPDPVTGVWRWDGTYRFSGSDDDDD